MQQVHRLTLQRALLDLRAACVLASSRATFDSRASSPCAEAASRALASRSAATAPARASSASSSRCCCTSRSFSCSSSCSCSCGRGWGVQPSRAYTRPAVTHPTNSTDPTNRLNLTHPTNQPRHHHAPATAPCPPPPPPPRSPQPPQRAPLAAPPCAAPRRAGAHSHPPPLGPAVSRGVRFVNQSAVSRSRCISTGPE